MKRVSAIAAVWVMLAAALAAPAVGAAPAAAQRELFQFRAEVTTGDGKPSVAYMYVPPAAKRVRGVIVGGMATSVEPMFITSPELLKVCGEESLAVVYLVPHVGVLWDRDIGNVPASQPRPDYRGALEGALAALAQSSGYGEAAEAPLFFYGHSVTTVFASLAPATFGDRCFGAMLHKGGLVIPNETVEKNLLGVPLLAVKGQFEEFGPGKDKDEDRTSGYKAMRGHIAHLRSKHGEGAMISLLVEPGGTHFPWAPEFGGYIADFVGAAARARIGSDGKVRAVDLAGTALSALDLDAADAPAAAARGKFAGKPDAALFHLTPRLAEAADKIHAELRKKPQFVTFADPGTGKPVPPAHDLRMSAPLKWVAADEFEIAALFLDTPPRKYPPLPEGEKAGNAEGPVLTRAYSGLCEGIGGNRYRVVWTPHRRQEFNLTAYHPGDATYRYAEQCAITRLPKSGGKPQVITFPEVEPVKVEPGAASTTVKLAATSDSGLPVRYTVESGPAVVAADGASLTLTEIPHRARRPLTIRVIAWQFGSMVEPRVQTAAPVTREILVR